jgi:hypothetical protein
VLELTHSDEDSMLPPPTQSGFGGCPQFALWFSSSRVLAAFVAPTQCGHEALEVLTGDSEKQYFAL